jgi:hypothetical protein
MQNAQNYDRGESDCSDRVQGMIICNKFTKYKFDKCDEVAYKDKKCPRGECEQEKRIEKGYFLDAVGIFIPF